MFDAVFWGLLFQVINFTMPNTVKHYVHRVGRTARAGRGGRSVSLVGETERKMLKDIVKKAKTPVKARVLPQGRGRRDADAAVNYSVNCTVNHAAIRTIITRTSLAVNSHCRFSLGEVWLEF